MRDMNRCAPERTDRAVTHLTATELAGYLDDDLPLAERRAVEEHLDACDDCRAEVVDVARVLDRHADAGTVPTGSSRRRMPLGLAGLAAAAVLAALLLVRPEAPAPPAPAAEVERVSFEGVDPLAAYAPADEAAVSRDALRFAWADRGTESYRVSLMTEAGSLIWSGTVTDTIVEPPAAIELAPGERFFWFVDAIDGGVVARTRPHSFIVAP